MLAAVRTCPWHCFWFLVVTTLGVVVVASVSRAKGGCVKQQSSRGDCLVAVCMLWSITAYNRTLVCCTEAMLGSSHTPQPFKTWSVKQCVTYDFAAFADSQAATVQVCLN